MTIIDSIILGIIQGAAEFLPISSSGHLVIMQNMLHLGEVPILYDILLHIPTLLATVILFRKKIIEIFQSLFRLASGKSKGTIDEDLDRINLKVTGLIIITTVITVGFGLVFKKFFDENLFTSKMVGIMFLITAALLISTRFISGNREYKQTGVIQSIIVGIAQGIGVLPGISRSGITITAGLLSGMKRENAGEYSFLISIPAILGALILELTDAPALSISPVVIASGMITAFVVGILSLFFLMKIIKSGKFYFFSFYLIPVGIFVLLFM